MEEKIINIKVSVPCLFCSTNLPIEGNKSGDIIECTSCNNMNNFDDAVTEVAKKEAFKYVESQLQDFCDEMNKEFK